MNYFVTAIGTDSGKTLVSAILTEMLQADYWKPVQSGLPRDTETVERLISNKKSKFHKEAYLFSIPASPHAAAKLDNERIHLEKVIAPKAPELVIEGAGGVMVPLNDDDVMLDLIGRMNAEVVLVSNLYLGSINHTLLTAELIKSRKLKVKGIIFNGPSNKESESIILKKTGYKLLLKIEREEVVGKEMITRYAQKLKECWE